MFYHIFAAQASKFYLIIVVTHQLFSNFIHISDEQNKKIY